jgi:hypothetical protein
MKAHKTQRKKGWEVLKDANDEYSDGEWEDVKFVVVAEVVGRQVAVMEKEEMVSLVKVVMDTQCQKE